MPRKAREKSPEQLAEEQAELSRLLGEDAVQVGGPAPEPAPAVDPERAARHEAKAARNARPPFAPKDLSDAIQELIVKWIEHHQKRPEFRRVQGALILVDQQLPARWRREFL